jgi:hypothetical protein
MEGKNIEISNPGNEVTIEYQLNSNNDEAMQKVSLASISCTQQNKNKEKVFQK